MRFRVGMLLSVFVLSVLFLSPIQYVTEFHIGIGQIQASGDCVQKNSIPGSDGFSLTWTSNWNSEPIAVNNDSILVGDHIVLNTTFSSDVEGDLVTRVELRIIDGFSYTTTRSLVPVHSHAFEPMMVYPMRIEECDWIQISDISRGDLVNITVYVDNECFFFAFDCDTPIDDYYFSANLFGSQMVTISNPTCGQIIWDSDSDTMVLGCYNTNNASGNYTIFIDVGDVALVEVNSSSIILDTYYLDNANDTYEISMKGYTETNKSLSFKFSNVTLCNFFVPQLVVYTPVELLEDSRTLNISWSCIEKNYYEVNFFDIWISIDDGAFFLLLAGNLTKNWYVWNSSVWLETYYLFRIRAYSLDIPSNDYCKLDNPPGSYYPGDFSDGYSEHYAGGVHSHPPEYYTLEIDPLDTIFYVYGSTGNIINLTLRFYPYTPYQLTYTIYDNANQLSVGYLYPLHLVEFLIVKIDGLTIGSHDILVEISSYSQSFEITVRTEVLPLESYIDLGIILGFITSGISIVSSSVIIAALILILRTKRNGG